MEFLHLSRPHVCRCRASSPINKTRFILPPHRKVAPGCVATANPRRLSRDRSNFSAELAAPARPDRAIGTGQGSRVAIRLRVDLGSTRCAGSSTQRQAHERVKIRPVARRPRPQPRSLVAWDRWWPRERVRPIQTDPRPTESGYALQVRRRHQLWRRHLQPKPAQTPRPLP